MEWNLKLISWNDKLEVQVKIRNDKLKWQAEMTSWNAKLEWKDGKTSLNDKVGKICWIYDLEWQVGERKVGE